MRLLACLAATALLRVAVADVPSPATDEAPPDATLQVHGGTFAVGVGFVWGEGTLTYQGADHKFIISGFSIADVGASRITASGPVSHLANLSDFEGSYVAWGAGAIVGSGSSAIYMKNQHGVLIKLVTKASGLRFHVSANGVKVRFAHKPVD
jgi:hypothetical protein